MKIILFFILSSFCWQIFAESGDWIYVTKKDDITVYTKDSKNSDIRALKALGTVDAPIEKVITILRDVKSAKTWVPNLIERKYVKEMSDTELIVYEVSDVPWPITDRDMILHHKISLSKDQTSIILYFKSVDMDEIPPNDDYVRAQFHFGKITFIPEGEKTHIEMIMLVDPMGSIPKWAVNIMQVSLPHNLISSLNKHATKVSIPTRPGIKELISKLKAIPLVKK